MAGTAAWATAAIPLWAEAVAVSEGAVGVWAGEEYVLAVGWSLPVKPPVVSAGIPA